MGVVVIVVSRRKKMGVVSIAACGEKRMGVVVIVVSRRKRMGMVVDGQRECKREEDGRGRYRSFKREEDGFKKEEDGRGRRLSTRMQERRGRAWSSPFFREDDQPQLEECVTVNEDFGIIGVVNYFIIEADLQYLAVLSLRRLGVRGLGGGSKGESSGG
ncbi:hypothetical protein O3P69_010887 [Scylla paramamosain]|uniref:Uncharacterized protein n=1 Tax=Scylla paramamosain TaxID=85552 RepID=A0AAW0TIT8_SCYPA